MPYIAQQFNCLADISWVVTAFLLAQVSLTYCAVPNGWHTSGWLSVVSACKPCRAAVTHAPTQTAMCPLVGRLSEIFGRTAMLLFAVSTFTIFSLGCALSNNIAQLAIFRGLAGVGGGAIMSSCVACRVRLRWHVGGPCPEPPLCRCANWTA